MVVLNFFGKIKPICISKKLKLYISNLPEEEHNEWQSFLIDELVQAETVNNLLRKKSGFEPEQNIIRLYAKVFTGKPLPAAVENGMLKELAAHMICIYFDYDYEDMPLGGWDTNCFDGRLCEEDCAEKVIDFINFLSYSGDSPLSFPEPTPQWIYSSNHDEIDHYRIFWGGDQAELYINSLIQWGQLFDSMLLCRNDYLLFDYLLNTIHRDNEYNEYHLLKSYSLCQLFLEKKQEKELDEKLPKFIDDMDNSRKNIQAKYLRKFRNKIAHGDFVAFEVLIEEFAVKILDRSYNYDYSEYSRKNWVILYVCCLLDNIVRKLVYLLLCDRDALNRLKEGL